MTPSILPQKNAYFDWKRKKNAHMQQNIHDTLNNVNTI